MNTATQNLSGPALDWAVATALGRTIVRDPMGFNRDGPNFLESGYWIWEEGASGQGNASATKPVYQLIGRDFSPSTNWSIGGPIIECQEIELAVIPAGRDPSNWPGCAATDRWSANIAPPDVDYVAGGGPTALVAAMRVYVRSKLGEHVDVPDALVSA